MEKGVKDITFIWASAQGNQTLLHMNNKGADQPAQSDQRIVLRYLERIVVKLATGKISIFYLVTVAW